MISQLCSFDDDEEEEEEGDDAGKAAETNSSVIAGLMEKKASGEILTVVPPDDGAMKQGVPIIVDLAFVSIFPLLFQSHSFYAGILRFRHPMSGSSTITSFTWKTLNCTRYTFISTKCIYGITLI